jgi:RTA1 like protein
MIAGAFLSASIYLILARIIPIYSSTLSRFQPRTYTILFITFDVLALLHQAIGGAIASIANDDNTSKLGINIMIAGVS